MMRDSIEAALQNWALWRGAGAWAHVRSSSNIDPDELDTRAPPDTPHYREATTPVLIGLAIDVDNVVNTLRPELQAVLRAEYLGVAPNGDGITLLTQDQRAVWLACSLATYERRLKEAREAVGDGLDERERRMQEVREALADPSRRGWPGV